MIFSLKNPWSKIHAGVQAATRRRKDKSTPAPAPLYVGDAVEEYTRRTAPDCGDEKGGYICPTDPDNPVDPAMQDSQSEWPFRFPPPSAAHSTAPFHRRTQSEGTAATGEPGVARFCACASGNLAKGAWKECCELEESSRQRTYGVSDSYAAYECTSEPAATCQRSSKEIEVNPWSCGSSRSLLFSPEQLASFAGEIRFNPLVTYANGVLPLCFDVRLHPECILSFTEKERENSLLSQFTEYATAPRLTRLRIIFRHNADLLEIRNPSGVTIGQVFKEISKFSQTHQTAQDYKDNSQDTQMRLYGAYHKNRDWLKGHQVDCVGLRNFDALLETVYFAGVMHDPELVEQRLGWRDPSVFVAMFDDSVSLPLRWSRSNTKVTTRASIEPRWAPHGN